MTLHPEVQQLNDKQRLDVTLVVIGEGLYHCRDQKERLRGKPKSPEKVKAYAGLWRLEQALKLVAKYTARRWKRTRNDPRYRGAPRNFAYGKAAR